MTNDNLKRIELKVEGMDCTNCALGIKKRLEKDGFQDVNVNFTTAEVSFALVDKTSLQQAKGRIHSMGYKVVEEEKEMKKGLSSIGMKFIVSLVFTVPLLVAMLLPYHLFHDPHFQLLLTIPVFAIGVWHFGKSAFQSIKAGVPNMDVLIILGASASFIYSLYGTIENLGRDYQFYETTASIITIILLGNLLEHRSVRRTTSAIDDLVKIQKMKAKRINFSGNSEIIEDVDASLIKKGDLLLVNTGDKLPVDGQIYWGQGSIDESMISGESLPADKTIGEQVIGGTILVTGSVKIKATAIGKEMVLSQIIEMVKQAQQDKPRMQNLADKISVVFVPVVVGISLLTFALSFWIAGIGFQPALMHSIAVLVIACPCALGLAIPTAVVVGIGRVAKNGILIKGGSTIEEFANTKKIVFDKTGTLTTGNFKIKRVQTIDFSDEMARSVLISLEKHSSHPIAKSIVKEFEKSDLIGFTYIAETKGLGMEASDAEGNTYKAGSYNIVKNITADDSHTVYLTVNNRFVAWLDVEDEIKPEAMETIRLLKSQGITTVLLSGDRRNKCEQLANELGIDEVYYEKNPEEKLKIIEDFTKTGNTAMVGDGINDAPALAKASVGISLSNATQIAIKSAHIVLLKGNLNLLPKAWSISRITLTTIKQNLFWAFFYNIIAIPVAAVGLLNPMIAAASMAFSDVFVVVNSLRLKNKKLL
ncbi:MAG: cation-translocating P-type ATPase [Bacteroidales bacterium]